MSTSEKESKVPTPFGVHCNSSKYCNRGTIIYLTREEYNRQLLYAHDCWRCPRCGGIAWWDDENYEKEIYLMTNFGWNLPPGIRLSDIPGNRPEDIRYDSIYGETMNALPVGAEKLLTALKKIFDDSSELSEIASACIDVVNILDPYGSAKGHAKDFISAFEDASRLADEWENPPEPEYDRDIDIDYDD